jgi:RHS repeat-associated protein
MLWLPSLELGFARFRVYDPAQGRWLSRDPLDRVEWLEGPNLYAYLENNPVNATDPTGLFGGEIVEVIGGEIVEVFGGEIVEVADELVAAGGEIVDVRDLWGVADRIGSYEHAARWGQRWANRIASERELLDVVDPGAFRFKTLGRYGKLRVPKVPVPTRSFTGAAGTFGAFFEIGFTILTMTDCDTVEGIFALVRQGKGGMANKYADRLMKQIEKGL